MIAAVCITVGVSGAFLWVCACLRYRAALEAERHAEALRLEAIAWRRAAEDSWKALALVQEVAGMGEDE